jgi:hypothetical protein
MHDPFQIYANMGIPYNVPQTAGINPLTGINPIVAPLLTNPFVAAGIAFAVSTAPALALFHFGRPRWDETQMLFRVRRSAGEPLVLAYGCRPGAT